MVGHAKNQKTESETGLDILVLAPMVNLSSVFGDSLHVTKLVESLASMGGNRIHLIGRGAHVFANPKGNITFTRVPHVALLSCGFAILRSLLSGRQIRYDAIYERGWHLSAGLVISRLYNIPLIFEADGFAFESFTKKSPSDRILRRLTKKLESYTYGCADVVIAPSPSVRETLRNELLVRDNRIEFIPAGTDRLVGSKSNQIESGMERPVDGRLVLCFVGRLVDWQGLDVVIRALESDRGIRKRFFVRIVGDGPSEQKLRAKVESLGLQDTVEFVGRVPHDIVHQYIAEADACLAPLVKWKSGFSLKIYEYMALGKPIIASRILDHKIVEDEGIGLLFNPDHSDDFVKCLTQLLTDFSTITEKAVRGKQLVASRYNWDSAADSILRTIYSVLRR